MTKALCFSCLHRENRPELGLSDQLIYCRKKEMVVRPKIECNLYSKATSKAVQELNRALYGVMEEAEE
ncbi:MAG: hypothetical protein NT131_02240 [Methanomassiliicoccales archaeon]|nr:hypothetical protein [Methanomassiliicoccales archaeon]